MSHSSLESGEERAHLPHIAWERVGKMRALLIAEGVTGLIAAVALERVGKMRALLIAEGVTGLIAAIASYLCGYLDGRAEIRNRWNAIIDDLKDDG